MKEIDTKFRIAISCKSSAEIKDLIKQGANIRYGYFK